MSEPAAYNLLDERTDEEVGNYPVEMPRVTLALKRLLDQRKHSGFRRLLPALGAVTGKSLLDLNDVVNIAGGAVTDKYSNVEKALYELCGKTVVVGKADSLDYDLHENILKWRQQVIDTHMAALVLLRIEEKNSLDGGTEIDPLDGFEKEYKWRPHPHEYCAGSYSKAIDRMGLRYGNSDSTDWRRAAPSSGRMRDTDSKEKHAAKIPLGTGEACYDAFMRKQMTICISTGSADISASGLESGGHGKGVGGHAKWVTYADVRNFGVYLKGLKKLSPTEASGVLDQVEMDLNEYSGQPYNYTLSYAYTWVRQGVRSSIDSKVTVATATLERARSRKASGNQTRAEGAAVAAALAAAGGVPRGDINKRAKKAKKTAGKKAKKEAAVKAAAAGGALVHEPGKRYIGGNNTSTQICNKFASGTCTGPCKFKHTAADAPEDAEESSPDEEEE